MNSLDALPSRFAAKIQRLDACWLWTSSIAGGYGRYRPGGRARDVQAHRFAYEAMVAPIPKGLVLDHLCRNQLCVNPAHLEPVTVAENTRRGLKGRMVTVCRHGHVYTSETTYIKPNGTRRCRPCNTAARRRCRARRLAVTS